MDKHTGPHPTTEAVTPKLTYLEFLQDIANEDVAGLLKAEKSYGDSWKRRGGVGAFMMLARKWDRLENALRPFNDKAGQGTARVTGATSLQACAAWDIIRAAELDSRSEGIIDDIRDLRRYLMLVEAEVRARGGQHGAHRDNQ